MFELESPRDETSQSKWGYTQLINAILRHNSMLIEDWNQRRMLYEHWEARIESLEANVNATVKGTGKRWHSEKQLEASKARVRDK